MPSYHQHLKLHLNLIVVYFRKKNIYICNCTLSLTLSLSLFFFPFFVILFLITIFIKLNYYFSHLCQIGIFHLKSWTFKRVLLVAFSKLFIIITTCFLTLYFICEHHLYLQCLTKICQRRKIKYVREEN